VRVVTGAWATVNPDQWSNPQVSCGAGERATGGSAEWATGDAAAVTGLHSNPVAPTETPTGWSAQVYNRDANNDNLGTFTVRAVVICASP
jgi:hypothetical protein